MTVAEVLLMVGGTMLGAAALIALYRLAKGPSSLDRGVASDVILAIVAIGAAVYAAWNHRPEALVLSIVLSLLGFTSAVGLARLITGATIQERRFREAEAAAAYAADKGADEKRTTGRSDGAREGGRG